MKEQMTREEVKRKVNLLCNIAIGIGVMAAILGFSEPTDNSNVLYILKGVGIVLLGIAFIFVRKADKLSKELKKKDPKFLHTKRKIRKELLNNLVLAAQKYNIKVTPKVYRKLVKPHLKKSFDNIALHGLGITFLVVGIIPTLAIHLNIITLSEKFQYICLLNAGLGIAIIAIATYKRLMIKRFYKKMINEIKEQQKSQVK